MPSFRHELKMEPFSGSYQRHTCVTAGKHRLHHDDNDNNDDEHDDDDDDDEDDDVITSWQTN